MYSVRQFASCLLLGADQPSPIGISVASLVTGPDPRSLLAAIRQVTGPTIDLHLVQMMSDVALAERADALEDGLTLVNELFGQVGIKLGRTQLSKPDPLDLDFSVIESKDEALALTESISTPGGGIDVFLVADWVGGLVGLSDIEGSCRKNLVGQLTGSVVALEGDSELTGKTIAHEVGHYLGLRHVVEKSEINDDTPDWMEDNLMYPFLPNGGQLSEGQGEIMRKHCAMRTGCSR